MAPGQWAGGACTPLLSPSHPSLPMCHTAPMAPPLAPSSPPSPEPTLQLGMRQKHLRALLKHGLFLEEPGSEGFAFFCLWNTVYLEQKDREGRQTAHAPHVALKCHPLGCAHAGCPHGCWGLGHQGARQQRRWVPGTLQRTRALLPLCGAGAGWGGQGLSPLLSWGIFPMWAVPAHSVLRCNHSPWLSSTAVTAHGCP